MEQEASFLFIAYEIQHLGEMRDEKGKVVYKALPCIRRACIRKPRAGAIPSNAEMNYHRVEVDFDPNSLSVGFVVYVAGKVESETTIYDDRFYFVSVFETSEEAEKRKEKLKQAEHKNYLEKGETFKEVVIVPVLVSES
jgi:hypothetical protein